MIEVAVVPPVVAAVLTAYIVVEPPSYRAVAALCRAGAIAAADYIGRAERRRRRAVVEGRARP